MADDNEWKGASWKQEEDFTKETDAMLEGINAELLPVLLRSSNKDVEAFAQEVMVLEKKVRLAGDTLSTTRLAVEVVKMFRTQKMYTEMLTKLDFLMKRRGQMKQVQSAMIAECAKALDELPGGKKTKKSGDDDNDNAAVSPSSPSSEVRTQILTQLVYVTAGKIHVELEHARFSVELAHIIETQQNSKKEAANMLSELQVETITQMPRLEKIEIILEQLRLLLELNDLVRIPSISRKISYRALAKKDCRRLKIRYFELMGDYFGRLKQYFMVAKCEHEIYLTALGTAEEAEVNDNIGSDELQQRAPTAAQRKNTHLLKSKPADDDASAAEENKKPAPTSSSSTTTKKSTDNDDTKGGAVFLSPEMEKKALQSISNTAILLLLSEHLTVKEVEDQSECCAFSDQTQQHDRTKWLADLEKNKNLSLEVPTIQGLVKAFNSQDLIRDEVQSTIAELIQGNPLLSSDAERQQALAMRLSEHDILVTANSFSQVRISRLAELVSLTESECEKFIMVMVNSKALTAKIDRIDGLVVFQRRKKASEDVEEWNKAVEKVAALVDKAAHLVVKERMHHRINIGAANAEAAAAAAAAAMQANVQTEE